MKINELMEINILEDGRAVVSDPDYTATVDFVTATITIVRADGQPLDKDLDCRVTWHASHDNHKSVLKKTAADIWLNIQGIHRKIVGEIMQPTLPKNHHVGLNKLRKKHQRTR